MGMKLIFSSMVLVCMVSGLGYAQDEISKASAFSTGEGVNGVVRAVAVQPDGKVVIGGEFSSVNGVPRNGLARLNADGTLDRNFANTSVSGVNGQVNAIVIQADGGIVVGGVFTISGKFGTMNLARILPDGTPDQDFGKTNQQVGVNGTVAALAIQGDGKILVGGDFTAAYGKPRRSLARLNADGTLDDAINPKTTALNGVVGALATLAADGAVAAGDFSLPTQSAKDVMLIPGSGR